jgi:hypothetical protein
MAYGDIVTAPPGASPATYRAARLHAAWSRVHIDVVETEPSAHGLRVRAVVDLGELTPADVRVNLLPVAAVEAATWPADSRMWSCESYANGRVLFERVLSPAANDGDGNWIVAVHPADAITEHPVVCPLPIAAWVTDRATGEA